MKNLKISKAECLKRREAYRVKHHNCWCLLVDKDGISICLGARPVPSVHHICGGRGLDDYEVEDNYYPLIGVPGHDHHLGWGHGQDIHMQTTQSEARLWCFALKYLIGECDPLTAGMLMMDRGLKWWKESMGGKWDLEDEIHKRSRILMARIPNMQLLRKSLTGR